MQPPRYQPKTSAAASLAIALVSAVGPAYGQAPSYGQAAPVPLRPDRIASVLPDGSLGPWRQFLDGVPRAGDERLAAVWDSYEADPRNYNRRDMPPGEFYDVPPGSGRYCFERRPVLYWCDPKQPGCERLPSCISTTGGYIARNAPDNVIVLSFGWGAIAGLENLQIEFLFFDTYNATDCDDPGSNMIGGFVLDFEHPSEGGYLTTADLLANGLDFDAPSTGRIGIRMIMWADREHGVHSERGYPFLWITKSDWRNEMGATDEHGFSDGHGDKNCEPGDDPKECVRGGPVCHNGDAPVGRMVLLLGMREEGHCQYTIKKDARPKKGCTACPWKGEVYDTADECLDKSDCRGKLKVKRIDCPDGGAGFCRKVTGKRPVCQR